MLEVTKPHNWRILHGRAGLAGKRRVILGGTVTRDAFYSTARLLLAEKHGIAPRDEVGLPVELFGAMGKWSNNA